MPFAGYKDFADCVAKNQDKGDPEAYCAVIKRQAEGEALIHPDFLKIYKQFIKHCKDETEGANRYAVWVKALNLDDTQPYGMSMREQFQWLRKHANYNLWKEDTDAKYWRVEAGFPLESMNRNVYTERELELAARTLKNQVPNLNHKHLMKPVEIVGSEYEDGVVECVLRVPNRYHCPGCERGMTLNEVLDKGLIVNVSLEASCDYTTSDVGACEGMHFTGLALLTKDVLPGIPLTRIMPLESIMVEALQSSTKTDRRKKKMTKLEMKIEQEDCGEGEHWDDEQGKCVPNVTEQDEPEIKPGSRYCDDHPDDPRCKEHQKAIHDEDVVTPECPEGEIWDPRANDCVPEPPTEPNYSEDVVFPVPDKTLGTGPGQRVLKPKSVQPDEHGQCPPGYIISTRLGNCILDESCPEGQHFDQDEQKCMPDTVPKPETPGTSVGTTPAPREATPDDVVHDTTAGTDPHERPMPVPDAVQGPSKDVKVPKSTDAPVGAPEVLPELTSDQPPLQGDSAGEIEPKPEHECQDGYHYDYDAVQCVPDSPITERVKRFQAEDKADSLKTKLVKMEKRYVELDTGYQQLLGNIRSKKQMIGRLEKQVDRFNVEKVNDEVKIRDKDRRIQDLTIARDDYKQQFEKLQRIHNEQDKKYNNTLAVNLELSRKLTKSNEDYLELASKNEILEAKLGKARSHGKKIVKIKV